MGRDCVLDNDTMGDIAHRVNDSARTWVFMNVGGGRRDRETDDCEDESEWASKFECVHI